MKTRSEPAPRGMRANRGNNTGSVGSEGIIEDFGKLDEDPIEVLEKLIQHIHSKPGAWFARNEDIARAAKSQM